jgi:hypothetical protein
MMARSNFSIKFSICIFFHGWICLVEYVKFLQSHPPITKTIIFCLMVYLSYGSSSGTNEINYQNIF